jgi:hypothetical protein
LSDSANVTDIESDTNAANDESEYYDEDEDEDEDAGIIDDDNSDDSNGDDNDNNNDDDDDDAKSVEIIDKDVFIECVKNIYHNTLDLK